MGRIRWPATVPSLDRPDGGLATPGCCRDAGGGNRAVRHLQTAALAVTRSGEDAEPRIKSRAALRGTGCLHA
jgi:hypothetical protein